MGLIIGKPTIEIYKRSNTDVRVLGSGLDTFTYVPVVYDVVYDEWDSYIVKPFIKEALDLGISVYTYDYPLRIVRSKGVDNEPPYAQYDREVTRFCSAFCEDGVLVELIERMARSIFIFG